MATAAKPPCDEVLILTGLCDPDFARTQGWVSAAAILGSSMAFIDGTVVSVVLPALQTGLLATISPVQWVIESYALFLSALMVTGGALGDLYGQRQIFTLGNILFAGRFRRVWSFSEYQPTHRCSRYPGNWRRASCSWEPSCADQRVIPSGRTRPCDRDLVRVHVHHGRGWTGTGRMAGAGWIVALAFLHQPADRDFGIADHWENTARRLGKSRAKLGLGWSVPDHYWAGRRRLCIHRIATVSRRTRSLGVDPVSFRGSPLAGIVLVR